MDFSNLSPPEDFPPGRTVWLHPKETIRRFSPQDYGHGVLIIAAANGLLQGLLNTPKLLMAGISPQWVWMAIPFAGIACLFLMARLCRRIGARFGGKGTEESAALALAWAQLPNLALWGLLLFGFFVQKFPALLPAFIVSALILPGVAGLWSFVLTVAMISEIHGFSAGRAFLTLLGAGFIFSGIVVLLVVAFFVGRPMLSKLLPAPRPSSPYGRAPEELLERYRAQTPAAESQSEAENNGSTFEAVSQEIAGPENPAPQEAALPARSPVPSEPPPPQEEESPPGWENLRPSQNILLKLKSGRQIRGAILEMNPSGLVVEGPEGLANVHKGDIAEVQTPEAKKS